MHAGASTPTKFTFSDNNVARDPVALSLDEFENLKTRFIVNVSTNNVDKPVYTISKGNNESLYGVKYYEYDHFYYNTASYVDTVVNWWLARLSVPRKILRLTSYFEDIYKSSSSAVKIFDIVAMTFTGAPSSSGRVREISTRMNEGLIDFFIEVL